MPVTINEDVCNVFRVWSKKIKYDVRKNFADTRVRIKGRFVRKDGEAEARSERSNSFAADFSDGNANYIFYVHILTFCIDGYYDQNMDEDEEVESPL